jgi:hypothetical protein
MTTAAQENLAHALETLSRQIASAPRTVIGNKVSVVAGPGSSGTIIGQQIRATAGPGSSGNVTGLHAQAIAGADPAADLVRELSEAAAAVRQDKGHRGWLSGLLTRAKSLTDRVVDATAVAAVQQGIAAVFGAG